MKKRLKKITRLLAMILKHLDDTKGRTPTYPCKPPSDEMVLSKLTTKQHAALQMILNRCTNAEIADRMKVSVNTAKGHVKSIADHCKVKRRVEIDYMLKKEFKIVAPSDYKTLSGGLPKDWHKNYVDPDPFFILYGRKRK